MPEDNQALRVGRACFRPSIAWTPGLSPPERPDLDNKMTTQPLCCFFYCSLSHLRCHFQKLFPKLEACLFGNGHSWLVMTKESDWFQFHYYSTSGGETLKSDRNDHSYFRCWQTRTCKSDDSGLDPVILPPLHNHPTQSMIYVHWWLPDFRKLFYSVVSFSTNTKHCVWRIRKSRNLIPRARLYSAGFVTERGWVIDFYVINQISQYSLNELPKGTSARLALCARRQSALAQSYRATRLTSASGALFTLAPPFNPISISFFGRRDLIISLPPKRGKKGGKKKKTNYPQPSLGRKCNPSCTLWRRAKALRHCAPNFLTQFKEDCITWQWFKSTNGFNVGNELYGADFEIIPTKKIPIVRRIILFIPTYSLLFPWQASPTGNNGSEAADPVVST